MEIDDYLNYSVFTFTTHVVAQQFLIKFRRDMGRTAKNRVNFVIFRPRVRVHPVLDAFHNIGKVVPSGDMASLQVPEDTRRPTKNH